MLVERAVEPGERGHEEDRAVRPAGERGEHVGRASPVVLDVLEHVAADDRVDEQGADLLPLAPVEREAIGRDAHEGIVAEGALEVLEGDRVQVRRDHELAARQVARDVAEARADLEDPRAEGAAKRSASQRL